MLVIKDGKNSQKLHFGYSCLKALGAAWGLPGIQSVVTKVLSSFGIFFDEKGNPLEVTDIPFDIMEVLIAILQAASEEDSFNDKDYGDWIFENMDQLGKVMEAFLNSLPQEKKLKAQK